jgi:transposase
MSTSKKPIAQSRTKRSANDPKASKAKGRKKPKSSSRGEERRITNPDAAGIDIGSREHYVAVPEGRDKKSVRSFSAYTKGLEEMAQWLKACKVKTVAMEATGVYWIPAFQVLEKAGLEVLLVDAYGVKHVPGRKSDVFDCQWLQELHTYGLLRGAFRPEEEICRVRTLQRHRKAIVENSSMLVQHMQKALDQMNLHLHHVLSNVVGESGLRMLDAILAGERDPKVLAAMANRRVRKRATEIEAALTGDYREEQLFVLGQALKSYRHMQQLIEECDQAILAQLEKVSARKLEQEREATVEEKPAPSAAASKPKRTKPQSAQERTWLEQLVRIVGVDLTQLPGLGVLAVLTIISEIGTNMSRWRNEKAFASWLGLCPNHKISGGRILSSRTRPVVCRTANILRMAATALGKTDTPLGAFYRRKKAQIGAPKATTATARKLACLVYRLIRDGECYQSETADIYELRFHQQTITSLRKRAAKLGFELVELKQAA